jgi:P27 family predicted phage terminase small subunit
MRGRKPKPTALKILAGNPGHQKLSDDEPQPPRGLPTCPAHLKNEARREWFRIGRELEMLGVVAKTDRAALAAYCQLYARWVEAEAALAEQGMIVEAINGAKGRNPHLGIVKDALEQMRKYLIEFGLTPSSRSRLHVAPQSKRPGDDLRTFLRIAQ